MSNFNFYKSQQVYREKYYQMPIIFFTNEKYSKLSNDAKIAYMLLKNRFDHSVNNNWVDNDDNIYFIYTIAELKKLLNCHDGKVVKIKKELEAVNLLRQTKGRVNNINGVIKTTPNLLYLGQPEISQEDVFEIQQETHGNSIPTVNAKIASSVKDNDIKGYRDSTKKENPSKPIDSNVSTVNAKIADNVLYSFKDLDTNRHLIDTEKELEQENVLLDNFSTIMKDNSIASFIPERVLNLIATFSKTYAEAQQTVKTIHNAKYKAQEEAGGLVIVFEELSQYGIDAESSLYATLLKAYQLPKNEEVKNMQNVIFTYVKNWFVEYPLAAKKQFDKRN